MRSDKTSATSGMTVRQKAIAVVFALILIVLIWQVWGLMRGSGGGAAPTITPATGTTKPPLTAMAPGGPTGMAMAPPAAAMPQPAQLTKEQQPMSQRELELLQMQQQSEAKYIATLNELQLLKLSRDLAETSQAISAAKLATVTNEKKILDLLKPTPPLIPPPGAYSHTLVNPAPVSSAPPPPPVVQPAQPEVAYSVISVANLQSRWSAVIGYQGTLFHVYIGDVLPPDASKVVSIDRSGLVLEKNGVKRKISLVPII